MKKRVTALLLAAIMIITVFNGCGKKNEEVEGLVGKWAYNHDTKTTILELKANGKAVYNGGKYTYTNDDKFIYLTSSDGKETKLRYEMDRKGIFLYQPESYVYEGTGMPDGLLGSWKNDQNWSFEFTQEGTFNENGYFPGYYLIDEEAGTVKLMYNDHFVDTTLYYSIDGNVLNIEYPWPMVRR